MNRQEGEPHDEYAEDWLCTGRAGRKIIPYIFDTSAIHGGRMTVMQDGYTDVAG